jgi:hypothetical protein
MTDAVRCLLSLAKWRRVRGVIRQTRDREVWLVIGMAMSDALFLLLGGLLGYALGAPDETRWHLTVGGIALAVIARCGHQISYAANNRLIQLRIDEKAARDRRRDINRRVTLMKLSRD